MAGYRADLDTWCGELYFELHRATLTTQALIKRWNRRAEEALRSAEMICAAAGMEADPAAEFDRLWKTTLVNQFHDIIPGSSIHRVYEETIPMLRDVVTRAREIEDKAARRLLARSKNALTVFNPSTESFAAAVKLPAGWTAVATADGTPLPVQREADGIVAWVPAPGQKFVTLARGQARARRVLSAPAIGRHALVLENAQVRYEFDATLRLVRAFDKEAGVEVIPAGQPGNSLGLFDDHPNNWDAWDIDEYYANQRLPDPRVEGGITRVAGEVRCGLQAVLRVGDKSTIRQQVWLEREGKRLDFVNEVDWREKHRILRVAFPTTIGTDKASAEIQYGYVQRNTADNTKWDRAQFECVGHRYADLSRHDYGAALLNDSKYGYRVKGRTLELSLLRAPTAPDPVADLGVHHFTYSFLPHTGDLVASDVRAHAAAINQGVDLFAGFAAQDAALPVQVTGEGIELAVLKRAEKEKCLVVRVVETRGAAAHGELVCASPKAKIVPTDLMEWRDQPRGKAAGRLALDLQPFEIRTFKVRG
jgi:alpha-mannosidase